MDVRGDDESPFELDEAVGAAPSGEPPLQYDGADAEIRGLPTRADLVRASDSAGLSATLAGHIRAGRSVLFMPTDVNESNEYVSGVPVYKLHLFGCLPDGAKAHVILDGIDVFFDVRVPSGAAGGFGDRLRQALAEHDVAAERLEDLEAFPVRGYREAPVAWKRVHFPNVQARRRALEVVRDLGHATASDDRTNFFRMVARVYGLVLTDWNALAGYAYYRGGAHADGPSRSRAAPDSPLCAHVFRVDVRKFTPLADPMAPKAAQAAWAAAKRSNPSLARDKTLVMAWDIETYSTARTGDVPRAANPADRVFMLCATLHWKDDPAALHRVCLVDVATEPDARWTTVVCGSEEGVVRAFAAVFRHFAPDVIAGFNDGGYDWPFVIETAQAYGALGFMVETMSAMPRRRRTSEESALRWNVSRDKRVKLGGGGTAYVTFLKVPGCLPVDVRVMFRQLFPKSDVGKGSSLAFYLRTCNLESKADMPYRRMWDAYAAALRREPAAAEPMRHVAHYCVIDAKRCQELLVKRNVLNDRRELAALSFVSLYDAVYYADGHKVCNMLGAYALRRGILCSHVGSEEAERGKYPGAFVFPPEKGLVPDPSEPSVAALEAARTELARLKAAGPASAPALAAAELAVRAALERYRPGRPVTGLDFKSLYPSIMMAYNLSPEKFVETAEEAARLEARGVDLHYAEFEFNGRTVRGWFVRHGGAAESYGLYPSILIDLYEKRSALKRQLGALEELTEHMEAVLGLAGRPGGGGFPAALVQELAAQRGRGAGAETLAEYLEAVAAAPDPPSEFRRRYREACFDRNAVDAKQKALKVLMNTFYGETGNSISPFFLLQLAGAVTTAGQYNILMVADLVRERGFRLKYGDTDSLYLVCPDRAFGDADRRYAFGELAREDYWAEMVRTTMAGLGALRDEVNAHLVRDNGTPHLRMAYEEVLFPVAFTGKKKYFGIAHVKIPNFRPKALFIKGIDVVKQGQTELAKKIGARVMWAAVALENRRDLLTIVEAVLTEAVTNGGQWTFDDFVQTSAWKPKKDNKPVQRFVARMRVRMAEERAANERRLARGEEPRRALYYVPDAGERFRYVLVRPGAAFSLRGFKAQTKKGDVMEYAEAARVLGLPIDVGKYLTSYVVGLCARFVNYAARFVSPRAADARPTDSELDKEAQAAAKKYLTALVAGLQNADPETMRQRGYAYKRAWKQAAQECGERLHAQLGPVAELFHGELLAWSDFLPDADAETVGVLVAQARRLAEASFDAAEYAGAFTRVLGVGRDGADLIGPAALAPEACAASSATRLYTAARILQPAGARRGRRGPLRVREAILSALDRREAALRARLSAQVPAAAAAAAKYETSLARAVGQWRVLEHAERPADLGVLEPDARLCEPEAEAGDWAFTLAPAELEALKEVRALWYSLAGVFRVRAQHLATTDHLVALKDRRQRRAARPGRAEARLAIAESARRLPPLDAGEIGDGGY